MYSFAFYIENKINMKISYKLVSIKSICSIGTLCKATAYLDGVIGDLFNGLINLNADRMHLFI